MTTSTSKLFLLILTGFLLLTNVTASFHQATGTGDPYENLEMPHYESNAEILTELVAPFLLIFFIFQMGLKQALKFALSADDKWHEDKKANRKRRNKYATLIALSVTLMLIPTKLFQDINELIFLVFGSLTYILFIGAGLFVFYMIVKAVL